MKFGPVPIKQAEGAILAHSLSFKGVQLRKGRVLVAADLVAMAKANVRDVTVAILDADDLGEDQAAEALAKCLVPDPDVASLQISAPFTGRVNIYANTAGIVQINVAAITQINAISPSITVATAAHTLFGCISRLEAHVSRHASTRC